MSDNVHKFTGRVAEYERYRERYDSATVLPLLHEWCGLSPAWQVADVGAGTGMLSEVFLANGNRVLAVEPNAEMRAACMRTLHAEPLLRVVDGTAEATGLESESVEMVSVGRALHWFAFDSAMREFERVLKPGGWVAVIAMGRAENGREENLAFEELLRPFTPEDQGTRAGYAVYKRLEQAFATGRFHHAEIVGEMEMGWEELRGKTLSYSHAPLPGSERFPELERALVDYYERYQNDGKVTLTTRCWVEAGRFTP
jgi:ubiquinone/menaquinone biosynthesis C-methylase UbiE